MNTVAIKEFTFDYILEQDNLTNSEKILLGTYVNESDKYQVMHLLFFGSMVPPMTEGMNKDIQEIFNFLSEVDWRTVGVKASVKAGEYIEKGIEKGSKEATKFALDPRKGIEALKRLARSWADYKVDPGVTKIGPFNVSIPKFLSNQWQQQYIQANTALHAGTALAAAAAAAMIFMVAKKAYKSTLSKAARGCRSYKGKEKGECIRKFHAEAIKKDITTMQKNRESCNITKKPEKCKAKVDKRITKQKIKLQKTLTTKKPKKL